MLRCSIGIAVALLAAHAPAQTIWSAELVKSQALVGRDEKGFSSCGFRSTVLTKGSNLQLYDFSLSLYRDTMGAMMKAGSYTGRLTARDLKEMKVRPVPKSFWIAPSDQGIAAHPSQTFNSESQGFLLGIAELEPSLKVIDAVMGGGALQFVVRYPDELLDKVVHYVPSLSDVDRRSLASCLGGIVDTWQATIETSEAR